MEEKYSEPIYTISIAAKLLKVSPGTLRIWENKGLIKPARVGKNRFYSRCDLEKLKHIKELLQEKHVNIEGVRNILNITRCWEIKKCHPKEREVCSVWLRYKNI